MICSSRRSFTANTSFHRRESNKIISSSKLFRKEEAGQLLMPKRRFFPWLQQIWALIQPEKITRRKQTRYCLRCSQTKLREQKHQNIVFGVSAPYGFGLWLGRYLGRFCTHVLPFVTPSIYFGFAD
jgi:hypothetical protein